MIETIAYVIITALHVIVAFLIFQIHCMKKANQREDSREAILNKIDNVLENMRYKRTAAETVAKSWDDLADLEEEESKVWWILSRTKKMKKLWADHADHSRQLARDIRVMLGRSSKWLMK